MRMSKESTMLRMPAQFAALDVQDMAMVDGGGKLGINPFKWFENITASITITWNGGALASVLAPKNAIVGALLRQLALNLKFNLT